MTAMLVTHREEGGQRKGLSKRSKGKLRSLRTRGRNRIRDRVRSRVRNRFCGGRHMDQSFTVVSDHAHAIQHPCYQPPSPRSSTSVSRVLQTRKQPRLQQRWVCMLWTRKAARATNRGEQKVKQAAMYHGCHTRCFRRFYKTSLQRKNKVISLFTRAVLEEWMPEPGHTYVPIRRLSFVVYGRFGRQHVGILVGLMFKGEHAMQRLGKVCQER